MYHLGLDIGGTNIAFGLVDEKGRIVNRGSVKTVKPVRPVEMTERLFFLVRQLLAETGLTLRDIPYIGIGSPGFIDVKKGVILHASNLYVENYAIAPMLSERLSGKQVLLANDADAAAWGEVRAGALQGADNAVMLTLGTGIGGGIIIRGDIYTGNRFAGEFGHMVIVHGGRKCPCGRKGCWERYASVSGLMITTRLFLQKQEGKKSRIWHNIRGDLSRISGRTAFDAMREGDALAARVVDTYLSDLACGVTNVIDILQPDQICIGGGISNEGEMLFAPLREKVEAELKGRHYAPQIRICKAKLGSDAGMIGAAFLGEQSSMQNQI